MADPGGCFVDPEHELADRVGMAMVRLNKMHAQVAHQMAKQGMDKSAFVLLANLAGLGECRSSALAEAVLSDPSTVSRQVAGLVKDGLVERRADPADGRASVLAVTEAGRQLLMERRRHRNEAIDRVFADWADDDYKGFADLFERFVHDYERQIPALLTERGLGIRAGGEK
ncbi:MarR family winged helix-turn-helix transcriptional regulator [Nocardia sp. NRRL S-836]|uniref:MarR family winged helix-turn-helix transcriptional regulator n=1 Tax=Nocardia sp. NRRL S-836 TaxID=1519492 RepID=UPI0006AECCBB|nr:MarR family transcriptional regulator [Nocardia sp. NRRL S-836]KOV78512.1 MarR family transcriptional regulator [Nocardia sp. NRRL S-836]